MENIHNKSATIRALGTQLSRRICTGQVIVSLAGACRELIDNAVDAGATNIEIRATDNGLECLEVIDNGTGISPSNFEHLCKAHSTSKLFELDDFRSLTTFGFRGEALNALAALGDVQITTRDANARCATRLTFDRNGESLAIEQCSRPQGTTVRVANLFAPLPVRRAEFQRQARREFLRLVDCVQACAIARPWCRFTCTNSVNGGKRMTVLCTPGGSSTHLPQVLDSLFGTGGSATDGKGKNGGPLLSLLDETVGVPSDECLQLYGVQTATTTMEQREKIFAEIRLSGFVSSCLTGQGRSSADRQFVFVNQRHVDFPKLCRIAKEVYTQFNRGRFCCLVLFVDVPPHTLDVNISPDKRTVFLHYEKEVFAKLRATLFATFAKCQGNLPAAAGENNVGSPDAKKRRTIGKLLRLGDTLDAENGNVQNHCGRSITFPAETQQSVDLSCMTFATAGLLDEVEQHTMNNEDELLFDQHTQQNQDESVLDDWTNDTSIGTKMSRKTEKRATKTVKVTAGQKALEAFSFQRLRSAGPSPVVSADQHIERPQTTTTIVSANPQKSNTDKMRLFDQMPLKEEPPNSQKSRYDYGESSVGHHHHCQFEFVASPTAVAGDERCASPSSSPSQSALPASQCSSSVVTSSTTMSVLTQQTQQYHGQQQQHDDDHHYDNEDEDEAATPTASTSLSFRPQQTVQVDMDLLRKNFVNRCEQKRMRQRGSDTGGSNIIDDDDYGTRLRIVTPTHAAADNANMRRTADSQQQQQEGTEDKEAVEQRLSMMLNKADFARMRLIGQFNNAFIIVRLRSDMFIIDQHAADEKYNFERLLAHTVIKSQRLIRPQLLRLGSVNVALIRDNLHVFHANGFDFQFNDGEPAEQDDVLCCEEEAQRNSIGPDDIDQNVEPIILDNAYATDNDEEDKLGTVLLTAVPVLHGWQLNRDDIDQLLSLLTELPGVIHRPSKVRKIFASKACRHSVMFGKALAQREMETNCPHGRPTIRHLCTVEKK